MANNQWSQRVCNAFRAAPHHHRYVSLIVMVGAWYVLEQVLHYEIAAKGIEVFGVVPFAERVFGALFVEGD